VVGGFRLLKRRDWFALALLGLTILWFLYLPGKAGNARFRTPVEGHMALLAALGLSGIIRRVASRVTFSVSG